MKKLNIKKVLDKEGFLVYPIRGISMMPLLEEASDKVHLEKSNEYKLFDIVLFQSSKNRYILHRIIGVKDNKYAIIGDNSFNVEYKAKEELLAKVVGIYKKDKYFDLESDYYVSYMKSFIYNDEDVRKELMQDSKAYFLNRKKEAYYELLNLELNKTCDKEKINKLTQCEKYAFIEYAYWKKAGTYLGLAVLKYGVDLGDENNKIAINEYESSKMRYLRSEKAIEELSKIFSEEKIPHTFLKGSETRKLYSSPHLRTTNDIDLLVKSEDYEKAKQIIIKKFNGKYYASTLHDESYKIESLKMMVELHHHINTDLPHDLKVLLEDPLSRGKSSIDNPYRYNLSNTDMMLIALSHAGKHMNGGEFWLTMLLDIYYLSKLGFDMEVIKKARLDTFYNSLMEYLNCILEKKELSEDLQVFEQYLFKNRYETYIALEKGKYTNKSRYILKRIWVPYRYLIPQHPLLKKHPVLLPLYEVGRWFRLIFKRGKFKKAMVEMDAYTKQNKTEINALINVGLKEYIVRIEDHNKRF